ncbi:MAG: transpeptidase [Pelagibacteraceae bacterium]|jgi:L,D-peptidoglycan transpeptidase YkuD (ErfK/YbiS/YcfS/YnhG family)|nr:transpeptidase [Pelagibacteraceae bacterium]|tara:strand:+ start:7117 stop:7608 length:492 start_codon:yes stop_codon:yes gene_type:complete
MIIVNKNGTLIHNKKRYKCALGKNGIAKRKKEGDKKTPAGLFSLGKVYYRKDKIRNLKTNLKKIVIKKKMAWCDDPNNKFYNKLTFTNDKSKEKLYRKDNLYNIIVVINYNIKPIIKNKGSAIFIHLARKNYSGTMGCIGLKKKDLLDILKTVKKRTKIKIIA